MASILSGTTTVATAGTAVQITTDPTPVRRVLFSWNSDNSASVKVFIGDSTIATGKRGFDLDGNSGRLTREVDFSGGRHGDLSEFWVDAGTNGAKVNHLAVLA